LAQALLSLLIIPLLLLLLLLLLQLTLLFLLLYLLLLLTHPPLLLVRPPLAPLLGSCPQAAQRTQQLAAAAGPTRGSRTASGGKLLDG